MTERQLATVELITALTPIPDADQIETARIRGWDVVVKKGEFQINDRVVYFEIDTFLPIADERFVFLAPRGVRIQDEIEGHVLKTARLRGQYSQGLAISCLEFPEILGARIGDDVTGTIPGLTKWDPPLPAALAGQAIGAFPDSFFRKTSEVRIQNLPEAFDAATREGDWVATEKIDGTSMSVIVLDGVDCVAGRDYLLTPNPDNRMWAQALQLELHTRIRETWPDQNVAVQSELFGPGIAGNPLRVTEVQFRIFTIQVGRPGSVALPVSRNDWPAWAVEIGVSIHNELTFPTSLDEALAQADKRASLLPDAKPGSKIEGLVWQRLDSGRLAPDAIRSFEVISNAYAMKHDR